MQQRQVVPIPDGAGASHEHVIEVAGGLRLPGPCQIGEAMMLLRPPPRSTDRCGGGRELESCGRRRHSESGWTPAWLADGRICGVSGHRTAEVGWDGPSSSPPLPPPMFSTRSDIPWHPRCRTLIVVRQCPGIGAAAMVSARWRVRHPPRRSARGSYGFDLAFLAPTAGFEPATHGLGK